MNYLKFENKCAYFASILLYHGFAASQFNLEVMSYLEVDASTHMPDTCTESGNTYFTILLNMTYQRFLNNGGDVQNILQKNVVEKSNSSYAIMATYDDLPCFLRSADFLAKSTFEPHFFAKVFRSFRFKGSAAKWSPLLPVNNLYDDMHVAENTLIKAIFSEESILWSKAINFKIVQIDQRTVERYVNALENI
ncbi:MAG: hypothetical protein ACI9TY_000378 [Alphaproteobacteria bacterium]|jgi:hypothetical protein